MDKKIDVRIIKSKRDLRHAMMELLSEKGLEEITVGQICERAMINKMTFYKHYSDKYALLADCVEAEAQIVYERSIGLAPAPERFLQDPTAFCVQLLMAVYDECVLHRRILESLMRSSNSLNRLIITSCIERMVKELVQDLAAVVKLKYPPQHVAAFLTGGFAATLYGYLNTGTPETRTMVKESVTKLFGDLMSKHILYE